MSDKIPSLAIVPAKKARLDRTLWNACIFCQRTHTPMLQATPIGAEKVKSAHESRIQFGDISSKDTLDRLTPNIEHLLKMNAKWHKSCYATFTGKQQLQRVEARQKTQEMPLLKAAASTSHTTPLTRTTVPRIDWKLCIFCQSRTRQDLHQVMSYSVSNSILNVAQTDYKLKCRIGENDLIAFEALYHKSCKLKAERNRPKEDADAESLQTDVFSAAFELLIQELDIGFKNGNVYNMRDVLQRYCKLLENIGMHEPSYRSFSRDTDVLVLAIHHNLGSNIWISCGTSKQPKFLPVHEIRNNMQGDVVSALPLYHAVTGCDSTSQFYGLGKKSTWSVLIKHPHLLSGLFTGRINEFISTTNISLVEQYIMLLYSKSAEQHQSINSLRAQLFHTKDNPSKLPPTSDAMKLHILRAMYQALVWYCAGIAKPDLPSPETCGWHVDKGHLVPTLMELEAIPSVCRELVSCGCHGDCSTARCSCKRASEACIEACKCNNCKNGVNRSEETDSDSEEDEIE